jgi:hypothetical protein
MDAKGDSATGAIIYEKFTGNVVIGPLAISGATTFTDLSRMSMMHPLITLSNSTIYSTVTFACRGLNDLPMNSNFRIFMFNYGVTLNPSYAEVKIIVT